MSSMHGVQVRLAVDCGSVTRVAVLAWPDGRWLPLQFDGQPWLSSAVHAAKDGTITVGEPVWQAAATDPEGFDANPLRHWPADQVVLSGVEVPAVDLVAATLRRVAEEAMTVAGWPVGDVRLVVPADSGPRRTTWLRHAAHRAGLGEVTLIPAPIAVAQHLAATGTALPVGAYLAVCDIGRGAEASVLRREPTGFELLSTVHDEDAGGTRLDTLLARRWTDTLPGDPSEPAPAVTAAARTAKQLLSRHPTVSMTLPAPDPPRVVTADDLHTLAPQHRRSVRPRPARRRPGDRGLHRIGLPRRHRRALTRADGDGPRPPPSSGRGAADRRALDQHRGPRPSRIPPHLRGAPSGGVKLRRGVAQRSRAGRRTGTGQ